MAGEDLQPFRIDPTMMAGMGGPIAPSPEAATPEGAAEKKDAGYPTLERIASKKANFGEFSEKLDATVKSLEQGVAGGSADDKAEAEKALKAYGHLSDMLKLLVELTVQEIKKRKKAAKK
ncbi:hypothetical protein ACFL59_00695 [Planctomycetota bacterium]